MSKTNKRSPARKKADGETASGEVRPAPVKKKAKVARKSPVRTTRASKPVEVVAPPEVEFASSSRATAVAEPPTPAPPSTPARKAPALKPTGVTSFGAGIFDDEEPAAVPVESPQEWRDDFIDEAGPSPAESRSVKDESSSAQVAALAPHDDGQFGTGLAARKGQEGGRRSRGRKSRKQRLAEEAEVLAALARGGAAPTPVRDKPVVSSAIEAEAPHSLADEAVSEEPPEVLILPVDDSPFEMETAPEAAPPPQEARDGQGRRRRRRGRRGRGRGAPEGATEPSSEAPPAVPDEDDEDIDEFEAAPRGRRLPKSDEDWPADVGVEMEFDEADVDAEAEARALAMGEERPGERREMLINVAESEECRIAILREGRLDELFIERTSSSSNVGNIYKGRVTNVEPSIQAAFIDFGLPSHGFLHISDLHPQYFPDGKAETTEQVGKKTPRRQRPPIQNCLKRGQEVIVQVIKEGIGTKGPTLTSYISLPGRFLVMMPGMDQLGVSRKIEDEDTRRRLRGLLEELTLPEGIGFIVRTAGVDRPRRDLQRDLNFLVRLWRQVEKRIKSEPAPAELYKESDLVIRTIRDVFDSNLRRIHVDSSDVANRIRDFLAIASPRSSDVVEVYEGDEPIFHRNGIEAEIDRLHSKTVPLPSGGSLVIEQTEAMVAIDVNSGRFRVPENAEETAFKVNTEAVDEIARQLRLRDLGGLIVCDLIDMTQERHRRNIEKRLADALRKHKERAKILRISRFGLLEMTRQRQRPSLLKSVFRDCPRCAGSGRVKSSESVALDVMRQIRLASNRPGVARIDVRVSTMVSNDLLNRKRHQLTDLERAKLQTIQVHGVDSFGVDQVELVCSDARGRDVHGAATHHHTPQPGGFRNQGRFQQRGGRRRGGRGRGGRNRPQQGQ